MIVCDQILNTVNVCPVLLNGMPLPDVNELEHLDNILQSNNKMSADCRGKRAKFISKVHSLNQEFHYADPYTICDDMIFTSVTNMVSISGIYLVQMFKDF